MYFIEMVNNNFDKFKPKQYLDYQEQQDQNLQSNAKKYVDSVEAFLNKKVLDQLKAIHQKQWEIEVSAIRAKCTERAIKEQQVNSKLGLGDEEPHWTEMLSLTDYKQMILDNWTSPPAKPDENFKTFEEIFTHDVGLGFSSKGDKVKWLMKLNTLRNNMSHSGSKSKGLTRLQVEFIEDIYFHFELQK